VGVGRGSVLERAGRMGNPSWPSGEEAAHCGRPSTVVHIGRMGVPVRASPGGRWREWWG
jgi:hypothetical protein